MIHLSPVSKRATMVQFIGPPDSRFLCWKRETAWVHSVHRLHSFSCFYYHILILFTPPKAAGTSKISLSKPTVLCQACPSHLSKATLLSTHHPTGHLEETAGTAGSLLLKYHHYFSGTFFYSLTFTTHIPFTWCPVNFVFVLLPDMFVVPLSPVFGGKEGERVCYFHSGGAAAFS